MRETYIRRLCRQCKTRFERLASFVKKRDPHFCSVKCARQYQRGRRHLQVRGQPVQVRPCEECGKVFTPNHKQNAGRFCSRPCVYKWNRGKNAPNWRGGRHFDPTGYVHIRMPEHPRARKFHGQGGYVREHIVVMEQAVGRFLRKDESVHHINGVRSDNRIENLQLRQRHHGFGQVAVCGDCGSLNIVHKQLGEV